MMRHLKEVHRKLPNGDPVPIEEFRCEEEECGKVFARLRDLNDHRTRVHGENQNIKCKRCKRVWKYAKDYRRHEKTCSRQKKKADKRSKEANEEEKAEQSVDFNEDESGDDNEGGHRGDTMSESD